MRYKGTAIVSDDWEQLFDLREMYGSEWSVFVRDNDPAGRYLAVKLLAKGFVESKANYWLSWDKRGQRLTSRGADARLLRNHRPELHGFLVRNLEAWA